MRIIEVKGFKACFSHSKPASICNNGCPAEFEVVAARSRRGASHVAWKRSDFRALSASAVPGGGPAAGTLGSSFRNFWFFGGVRFAIFVFQTPRGASIWQPADRRGRSRLNPTDSGDLLKELGVTAPEALRRSPPRLETSVIVTVSVQLAFGQSGAPEMLTGDAGGIVVTVI